ncbi:DotH/IcmK family type IV secretion protein [Acidithiobacillus ferrooxidans]|uniref:DotH/IcmK family type IV secretion protein n=1 Tax=Acidithiobacillus ferrooxidans TaxID=920 RepID=UPI0013D6A097|nr:DotH/IcmK family type IV secretion protein [Acidithiobacillus ferrooxidans]
MTKPKQSRNQHRCQRHVGAWRHKALPLALLGSLQILPTVAVAGVMVLEPGGAHTLQSMPRQQGTPPFVTNGAMPASSGVQPIAGVPAASAPAAPPTGTASPQAPVDVSPNYSSANPNAPQANAATALPPLPEGKAFQNSLKAAMPLTSAQIAQLRTAINANRQAQEAPLAPAMPRLSTINARIGVGNPPAIAVQGGFVSTINVVDAYGRPWPIERYSLGNPKAFTASVAGNSAAISDLQPYAQSNLALYLQGEATPLMVALVPGAQSDSGGGVVDYSVRIRINTPEPGLPAPAGGMAGGADYTNTLLSVVQGVGPAGAKHLRVVGDPARVEAWTWEGPRGTRLLLRAPATVIAPAWIATMQGPGGIQAWVLPDVHVVTLSQDGRTRLVVVKHFSWESARHG